MIINDKPTQSNFFYEAHKQCITHNDQNTDDNSGVQKELIHCTSHRCRYSTYYVSEKRSAHIKSCKTTDTPNRFMKAFMPVFRIRTRVGYLYSVPSGNYRANRNLPPSRHMVILGKLYQFLAHFSFLQQNGQRR